MHFFLAELAKYADQPGKSWRVAHVLDLLEIVTLNEGLDSLDCMKCRAAPKHCGARAQQPARGPPQGQQAAVMPLREPPLETTQMSKLGADMGKRKLPYHGVSRYREHTPVNLDGTRLSGMVRPKIRNPVR